MDRWQVIKNWREALERVLSRVYPRLKQRQDQSRSTPFPKRKKPRTLNEHAASELSRQLRLARYEQVLECYQQGLSIAQIAQHLHLARGTIYKYLTVDSFPERSQRSATPGAGKLIAPYTVYLRERCAQGCQNAQQLSREIQAASDFQAIPERCSGGCKHKACFPVETSCASFKTTGSKQRRKRGMRSHQKKRGNQNGSLFSKKHCSPLEH
jgi:hypothetical protein